MTSQPAVAPVRGPARDLSMDEFMTGLLAAAAARGVETISIRGEAFYSAIESAYQQLESEAYTRDLNIRFFVMLDPVYGDSPIVRDAISGAVQRDLVSLDNPEYQDMRLKIGLDEAAVLLDRLPGGAELFGAIASAFLSEYPWVVKRRRV